MSATRRSAPATKPPSTGSATSEPTVVSYDDITSYVERVTPFLARDEAVNNLPLGVLSNLRRGLIDTTAAPVLLTVERGGEIEMTALMTPPWNLAVSRAGGPVLDVLAEYLHTREVRVPGLIGPDASVRDLARRWHGRGGPEFRQSRSERIYQLETVVPPAAVPGRLRVAQEQDVDLVCEWFGQFCDEVELPNRATKESVARRVADGRMFFWLDTEPVALAGWGGDTPNGGRVGPVYTPPALRRRGYASALTACVSQHILDSGKRYCFLFTDLANPTSNKIYQEIGYRSVEDVAELSVA